ALEALRRGARVTVITGPAEVAPPAGAEVVRVETAEEMLNAVLARAGSADIVIGAAAVADYRVADAGGEKRKRNGRDITLKLIENPDIIAQIGSAKKNGQLVVGFAAETQDLLANAREKLTRKQLDLIVANAVNTPDSGFGADTTKAWFLTPDGAADEQPLMAKTALAEALFDRLAALLVR
ncbi:MAG: phosphopantothenoylcysteine decarboxylase, partial [Candidatus Hydrogenedentales bacterium]